MSVNISETGKMLSMLLANLDSLKAEMLHAGAWDTRKPTIYYLNRNMEWAREVLSEEAK